MASICRLAGKRVITELVNHERRCLMFIRPVTIKATPHQPEESQGYIQDNIALGRPLSPHLSIYSSEATSVLSILHRISGAYLGVLCMTFALVYPFIPAPHLIPWIESLHIPYQVLLLGKAALGLPVCYHGVNGLRHLSWDCGKNLSLRQIYVTGALMVLTSGAIGAFIMMKAL